MFNDLAIGYATSNQRLFLLDYDGTLADLMPTPPQAAPTPQLLTMLEQLATDDHNTVVIVSGRSHDELEAWLSHLPLHLVAEHGLFSKDPGQPWRNTLDVDLSWKPAINSVMQVFVNAVHGASIEDKTASMVWHYGAAKNPVEAQRAASRLSLQIEKQVKANHLRLLKGNKIVEVQPESISKAAAVHFWVEQKSWDFIFGAGDDTTDEDLFGALPSSAWSIKVGKGQSTARLSLTSPRELRSLLELLLA